MKRITKWLLATALLLFAAPSLWAQDNTWELGEDEADSEETAVKANPDAKYLQGAVTTTDDGRVVFSKTIEAPGKSAQEIYDILLKYMTRMTREKNQLNSQMITTDPEHHRLGGSYEEWLVFKATAISLDQTRFYFVLEADCQDGRAVVEMNRIRYLYEENRNPQRMKAEQWITDREAVNKKNTKLLPFSGKFRRKTIDRKDFIFNKFETLLK